MSAPKSVYLVSLAKCALPPIRRQTLMFHSGLCLQLICINRLVASLPVFAKASRHRAARIRYTQTCFCTRVYRMIQDVPSKFYYSVQCGKARVRRLYYNDIYTSPNLRFECNHSNPSKQDSLPPKDFYATEIEEDEQNETRNMQKEDLPAET